MMSANASSYGAPPSFIVGAFCDITQRKLIALKNHTLPSLFETHP